MNTITRLGTWDDVVAGHDAPVVEVAELLRQMIVELDPEVTEVPRAGEGSVAYGLGEKKMSEAYCYLMPQKDRVNLGFFHGIDVPDPSGVLEGTGKRLRHVKVWPGDGVLVPSFDILRQLVADAREERVSALSKPG